MLFLIRVCGLSGWALLAISLIALVSVGTAIISAIRRLSSVRSEYARHGVLFWGGMAAVLGFLSQCAAVYEAMTTIMTATAISSQVIRQGFGESFVPSLWGFSVLTACAIVWAVLGLFGTHQERSLV